MQKASVFFALALAACGSSASEEPTPTPPAESAPTAPATPAIEPLPEPTGLDMRKVTLGRGLFHDTRLSGDQTLSCSSCHSLDHGGAEPRVTSTGIRAQVGPINSPTVLNASLN